MSLFTDYKNLYAMDCILFPDYTDIFESSTVPTDKIEFLPESRLTFEELKGMVPEWCNAGTLVRVDKDYFEHYYDRDDEEDPIGMIVNYWILDLEQMDDEDYNDILSHHEWLIIDVMFNGEVQEHVPVYVLSEIKKGEENA